MNAPMIGASCAPLAAAENPKVRPAARTPIVAGETARSPMSANKRGTTKIPMPPATAMNPTAIPMVLATPARSTDPC